MEASALGIRIAQFETERADAHLIQNIEQDLLIRFIALNKPQIPGVIDHRGHGAGSHHRIEPLSNVPCSC